MDKFGYFAAFVLLAILGVLVSGFCISVLWGWFVSAKFGLPILSIAEGAGLGLLFSYINYRSDGLEDQPLTEKLKEAALMLVFKPIVFLGIGIAVVQFI